MTIQRNMRTTPSVQPHLALARLSDFEAVATLFGELHGYNASLNAKFTLLDNWRKLLYEHFTHSYETHSSLWLLAWLDQVPVGLLVLENHQGSPLFQYRHWVELVALYVVPHCRQTGLAQQLMAEAESWTATRGVACMQLYVTVQNEHARAFYHRCGWHPAQEIWHLDVAPLGPRSLSLTDPSCETQRFQHGDLLEHEHHHLAMERHPGDEESGKCCI